MMTAVGFQKNSSFAGHILQTINSACVGSIYEALEQSASSVVLGDDLHKLVLRVTQTYG